MRSSERLLALTAGLGGGIEGLRDLRVHLDGEALLDHELLVPELHLLRDPLREDVSEDGGAHVCNPGLGHLLDLFAVRQVGLHVGVLGDEVGNVVECQPFVLRDSHMPHLIAKDGLLDAADEVLEEVDGHLLVRWQVDVAVDGAEVEALAF